MSRYILTDQIYVQRLLQRNIDENISSVETSRSRSKKRGGQGLTSSQQASIRFTTLDWETDEVTSLLTGSDDVKSFDAVVACDCIYNYALVPPFVQACVDACRLRITDSAYQASKEHRPCVCVIGQQLRNDEVFQLWLTTFHATFHVWRVPDDVLPENLRSTAGFVVHIGILREQV